MTKLLTSIQLTLKEGRQEQKDAILSQVPQAKEGYMNHLMKVMKDYQTLTERLILMEAQVNLQKDIVTGYQDLLSALDFDVSTFFVAGSASKARKKFQLKESEMQKLVAAVKKLNSQYDKWRKLPLNVADKPYNEVVILNESIFDEYSQYYTQYKSQRAEKRSRLVESTVQDFDTKEVGVECVLAQELAVSQEAQVNLPLYGIGDSDSEAALDSELESDHEEERKGQSEEKKLDSELISEPNQNTEGGNEDENEEEEAPETKKEYKMEDLLQLVQTLSEERDSLRKLAREQKAKLAEMKKYLISTSSMETTIMQQSQRVQELEHELRQQLEENSLCLVRLADEKSNGARLEKQVETKEEEAARVAGREETCRAQIVDLRIQLSRAHEAEAEHTKYTGMVCMM